MPANRSSAAQPVLADNEDIFADPISSSDEEISTLPTVRCKQGTNVTSAAGENASRKRTSKPTKTFPRKRLHLVDSEDLETAALPTNPLQDEWSVAMSSSQGRKRKAVYGSQKSQPSSGSRQEFSVPSEVKSVAQGSRGTRFSIPSPNKPSRSGPKARTQRLEVVSPPKKKAGPPPAFTLPDEVEPGSRSTSIGSSSAAVVFDIPESNLTEQLLSASTSIDSLTSLGTFGDIQKNLFETDMAELHTEELAEDLTPRCPLCSAPVSRSHLEEFNYSRRMNIRMQQRFCQSHKRLDALAAAESRGYPSKIDWEHSIKTRIGKQMRHLTKVLMRKIPSHYRTKLEEAAATDNARVSLRRYLRDGYQEVVHPGYYGPKGQRIFTHEITTHMSKALKEALRKDKIIRAAEVGGYISAVLLPELTLRLVMEDQGLADDKVTAALQILEESTQAGIDLWGLEDEEDERVTVPQDDADTVIIA